MRKVVVERFPQKIYISTDPITCSLFVPLNAVSLNGPLRLVYSSIFVPNALKNFTNHSG
jgi:hypothetical protein